MGPHVATTLKRFVQQMFHSHFGQCNIFIRCSLEGCPTVCSNVESFRKHVARYHRYLWGACERASWVQTISAEDLLLPESSANVMGCVDITDAERQYNFERDYDMTMEGISEASLRLRMSIEHQFENPTGIAIAIHSQLRDFTLSVGSRFEPLAFHNCTGDAEFQERLSRVFGSMNLSNSLYVGKREVQSALRKYKYIHARLVRLSLPSHRAHNSNIEIDDVVNLDEWEFLDNPWDMFCVNAPDDLPPNPPDETPPSTSQVEASGIMHCVPIIETITRYLSHDDVPESILNEKVGNHLEKYTSGALFKTHPIFKDKAGALRIILY